MPKEITLLNENLKVLAQATRAGDSKGISRILGLTAYLRRNLSAQQLLSVAGIILPKSDEASRSLFVKVLGNVGKWGASLEADAKTLSALSAKGVVDSLCAKVYLYILAVGYAMRTGKYTEAAEGAIRLVAMLENEDSVLRGFLPRVYMMLSLCYEKLGTSAALRPQLVQAYGLASSKHDTQSQAVVLNLLLRNYIKAGLIESAEKFIKNANAVEKMSDSAISVNQQARFLYYWGECLAFCLKAKLPSVPFACHAFE